MWNVARNSCSCLGSIHESIVFTFLSLKAAMKCFTVTSGPEMPEQLTVTRTARMIAKAAIFRSPVRERHIAARLRHETSFRRQKQMLAHGQPLSRLAAGATAVSIAIFPSMSVGLWRRLLSRVLRTQITMVQVVYHNS